MNDLQTEPRELLCMICDKDYTVWYAPNDLWNKYIRLPDGSDTYDFLCPNCFIELVDQAKECIWKIEISSELTTTKGDTK